MSALALCAPGTVADALELPAGTTVEVRLKTSVSSRASASGDKVEAVVIAPILVEGHVALPAGWTLRGTVAETGWNRRVRRPQLRLAFDALVDAAGRVMPVEAQVVEVDNARETVQEDGKIVGLPRVKVKPTKFDAFVVLLAQANPLAVAAFEAGKVIARRVTGPVVAYAPGVEMRLRLKGPVSVAEDASADDAAAVVELPVDAGLIELVNSRPLRVISAKFGRVSDVTNFIFLGTEEQLRGAFAEAGWTLARAMGARSATRALVALIQRRSYRPAPVSLMRLEGRRPDIVFEKQNNTLAKRHHVRIWRQPDSFRGEPLWVGAASHDVGITYVRRNAAFTHMIDPHIDAERTKLLNDLLFTGLVEAWALVERPEAPRETENATGEWLETDGRMAVLSLRQGVVQAPR